jgi:hypothetical protein
VDAHFRGCNFLGSAVSKWKPEHALNMIAKVNAEIKPAHPRDFAGLSAELYDADPLSDDFLASAVVQSGGRVEFLFDTEDFAGGDTPFETFPDLYIVVKDPTGSMVFKSLILRNVSFEEREAVSRDRRSTLQLVFPEGSGI